MNLSDNRIMKKAAILQSNYIPWKGYFDLIASVDTFIWYDEVQYTKQDWRNRNKIKTPNGIKWLSVPVTVNGLYKQKISETLIADTKWGVTHWAKIEAAYSKAKYFDEISSWLKPLFVDVNYEYLFELNRSLILNICKFLEIDTQFECSSEMTLCNGKVEKLVDICTKMNAKIYVSGAAAKNYLSEKTFNDKNIQVEWFEYSNYPLYDQLWGEFTHEVSILDVMFNTGKNAKLLYRKGA